MNPYIPVLLFLIFATVIGLVLTGLSNIIRPFRVRDSKVKQEAWECGVPMVTDARERMSVKFYLTAILFILFDIETVFMYIWARVFRQLGWFGVIEISVFLLILLAGYIFVLKRGALEWET